VQSCLALEDEIGGAQMLPRWRLLTWLKQSRSTGQYPISGVFINSCDSDGIGSAFVEAGVPHVVCCKGKVFDSACKSFTSAFYRALAAGRTVFASFDYAREAVACAPQAGLRAEAAKFLLLPRQEDMLSNPQLSVGSVSRHYTCTLHDLLVGDVEDHDVASGNVAVAMQLMAGLGGPDDACSCMPPQTQHFLGRTAEMLEMARHLARGIERGVRVVNVWGRPGLGKSALLAEFTRFIICPGRLFAASVVWVPLTLETPHTLIPPAPPKFALERTTSGKQESYRCAIFLNLVATAVDRFVEAFGNESAGGNSPERVAEPRGSDGLQSRLVGLIRNLRYLERGGRPLLLVLDGIEDFVDSSSVHLAMDNLIQGTERLCMLFGSRIHVRTSFGGMKTDNLELKPLKPRDAAQLFLYRVHRHIYWKDVWRTKAEWMAHATRCFGESKLSKIADATKLERGEVPIALDRANRDEALAILASQPLLAEFCQGIPQRIRQTAERVTDSMATLWDLLEDLRSEKAQAQQGLQDRILAPPQQPSAPLAEHQQQSNRPHRPCPAFANGGEWQLGKVIGQGAYGVVYHARCSTSGESFAVKVTQDSPELRRELELYEQLDDHDHIVRFYGHEAHDRQLYMFLEYMPEGSLKDKLREFGAFQESLCRASSRQILLGLGYLHCMRVLHRDLKCSNLLLDPGGRVKISDFGCARWLSGDDRARTLVGSPWWLAPEIISGKAYNEAADIWSFGCTVVELLTGELPWSNQITADNPLAAANQVAKLTASGEQPLVNEVCTSEACRNFLWSCCLAVEPIARKSVSELLQHAWVQENVE